MSERSAEQDDVEDDGPECETCGKTTCPDADLPGFSEPRRCFYEPIYHVLADARDCDYGCARDYTNQHVRLQVVRAVEPLLDVARAEGATTLWRAVMAVLDPLGDPLDPAHLHPQTASVILRVREAMQSADLSGPPEARGDA